MKKKDKPKIPENEKRRNATISPPGNTIKKKESIRKVTSAAQTNNGRISPDTKKRGASPQQRDVPNFSELNYNEIIRENRAIKARITAWTLKQ
jgi:hypothetical protein